MPSVKDRLLESTAVYRLWMAPFAEAKFDPIRANNDFSRIRRVLDVGCGPGTNTEHFTAASYLGLDINESYIEDARRRFGRDFLAVDVTQYTAEPGEQSDFVLLNSFLHHVTKADAERILSHLATLITEDGHIHIIELVLPPRLSVARKLAQWDRGDYPRPLEEWRSMFEQYFEPVVFEPYSVGMAGVELWQFVYFKGRPRRPPLVAEGAPGYEERATT